MEIGHILRHLLISARRALLLIADSAETTGDDTKSDNAAAGGVYNYRTDALDDGTDSAGWYGHN